jgi:hypothetical protein
LRAKTYGARGSTEGYYYFLAKHKLWAELLDDLVDDGLHFRAALFEQQGEAGDDQAIFPSSALHEGALAVDHFRYRCSVRICQHCWLSND